MSTRNYIDNLMTNHNKSDSLSESDYMMQYGGGNEAHRPRGGFPPIYVVEEEELSENVKKREISVPVNKKGTVSILDIMKQRIDNNK